MGATVKGTTVSSKTVENDDEVELESISGGGQPTVTMNSMGTSPAVVVVGGGARCRLKITTGTGTPAIAANNVVVTLPAGTLPRRVFLASLGTVTPCFHVSSVSSNVINIGTKVAPVLSTGYELELIVLF